LPVRAPRNGTTSQKSTHTSTGAALRELFWTPTSPATSTSSNPTTPITATILPGQAIGLAVTSFRRGPS